MNINGWIKQEVDNRDYISVRHTLMGAAPLPTEFKLPITLPVYDQSQIGSCVANSGCLCYLYEAKQKSLKNRLKPSRLFLYYNARAMRGWELEDSGAIIRDAFKSLNKEGVCTESLWKYDISKFAKKPPKSAYKNGLTHTTVRYATVPQTIDALKRTLISGACISFGFDVYESFISGNWDSTTGIMPLPKVNERIIGGHAIGCVGYSDLTQTFTIQNSWGTDWGKNGYFQMPYSFITSDACSDFWCIESIS